MWEDVAADYDVEYWPCMERSLKVFCSSETQWRIGPKGPYGLDYSALPFVLQAHLIDQCEWLDVLEDLRVLESAALSEMRSQ